MKKSDAEINNLSRREFIINSTGTGFAALLLACGIKEDRANVVNTAAADSPIDTKGICALTPEKEEGPFFIEGANVRRNIRDDSAGKNLLLKIQLVDIAKNCQPIQNAVVNIWHCSAEGVYSGYENMNPGSGAPNGMPPRRNGMRPPPPPGSGNRMPPPNMRGGMHAQPTSDKRFLRGVQITDGNGQVEFETIYPGWYEPRAVHIHTKIFLNDKEMLTTQMFFPEELNDRILSTVKPYQIRGANPNKTADDPVAGENPPFLTISETGETITASIIIGVKSA